MEKKPQSTMNHQWQPCRVTPNIDYHYRRKRRGSATFLQWKTSAEDKGNWRLPIGGVDQPHDWLQGRLKLDRVSFG
jgi:hypothetical protein